jgi:GNAT superfamily N-acetyltransferase
LTDASIAIAALNNVLQSEAVLAAAGSAGTFTDTFWTNAHTFDIPYANGATLSSAAHGQRHFEAVEQLTTSRPGSAPTYVMDSWAALDLAPLGYSVRIADKWFLRDRALEQAASSTEGVEIIDSASALAEWEAASVVGFGGVAPDVPGHTYPAILLGDERFTFFAMRIDGELCAGVMLFRDPHCTGVYTFFTLPEYRGRGLGTDLLSHALSRAPDLPLATNPSEMSRGIFSKLGFRAVGERRIWVHEPR